MPWELSCILPLQSLFLNKYFLRFVWNVSLSSSCSFWQEADQPPVGPLEERRILTPITCHLFPVFGFHSILLTSCCWWVMLSYAWGRVFQSLHWKRHKGFVRICYWGQIRADERCASCQICVWVRECGCSDNSWQTNRGSNHLNSSENLLWL